jgi:hypothetical protein
MWMTRLSLKWPIVVVVSAVLAEVLAANDVASPLRSAITLWFLVFCPGLAFIPLLQLREFLYELVLMVALSLALALLVATGVLYAGLWSPQLILRILIGLSLIGVACQLFLWLGVRARGTVQQT